MNNKLPSCLRRGQGVVNPNDRRSPLASFSGQPAPRLHDRVDRPTNVRIIGVRVGGK